ncbi:hypothetical protein [Glycomyces buryatensis]|uniref:Uncharacterized protein n=1 Tax=Glycomyces buryatensis TaxID=2570927 RepID=A0A4S8QCV8_9ACTN|nr:hypothetical protein [Glycomyces buryatensis]THV40872.1 hypothetical protein FAB82_13540 [Glycomyces buryatensis]
MNRRKNSAQDRVKDHPDDLPNGPTGSKIAEIIVDGRTLEFFLPEGNEDKVYVAAVERKYQPIGAVIRLERIQPSYATLLDEEAWAAKHDRADRIVQLAVACYWNCLDHHVIRESRSKGRAVQWLRRFTPRWTDPPA